MKLTDAEVLVKETFDKHGLTEQGWTFKFDRARNRFGRCNRMAREISLSKYLVDLNSEERVMQTIFHEIAHALTPRHHHDFVWKQKCREIGGNGKRCFDDSDTILYKK
jgi:predicted SprT family Zn-dependent metalloprotease